MQTARPDLCHCLAFRRSARMLSRVYDRHLAPARISISQFALLSYVGGEPGLGTAALAAKMEMERTTLVRALKPLRTAALIDAQTKNSPDLRYELTQEGRRILILAIPLWEAAQHEYETRFDRGRAKRLRDDLQALMSQA